MALASPPAVDAATWKNCGYYVPGGGFTYKLPESPGALTGPIRARLTSCRTARRLAKYGYGDGCDPRRNRTVCYSRRWTCYIRFTGYESASTVCKAQYGQRVRFQSGA